MSGSNRTGEQTRRSGTSSGGTGVRTGTRDTVKSPNSAASGRTGAKRDTGTKAKAKTDRTKKPATVKGAGGVDNSGNGAPATIAEIAGILPVRDDEQQWTAGELEEVRAELEGEVEGLRREIERAETDIAARLRDPSDGAGDDQADTGAKTFEREHEMSLANNARDMLSQNESAIGRIDAGTYGVCGSCGNPIGKARLQAFPRAALCVACKQREERR